MLADVAHFSPFHFHRIFAALVGETLNQFVRRLRVEKAASLLLNNPKLSITEVALDCGFSGSSTFARAFKETFHVSATEWRQNPVSFTDRKNGQTQSKNGQSDSKEREACDITSMYIGDTTFHQKWRISMKKASPIEAEVEVKQLEPMHVAYIRHVGSYKGNEGLYEQLIGKIMKWAGPRGLVKFPESQLLYVYHDNPEVTDEEKLRLSVCLTVPEDTEVSGEIGRMTIPGGQYAVGYFEISGDQFQDAWNLIFGNWLPESGYQPDDRPAFEKCLNNPKDHPEGKHIVEIHVPVKPL